MAALSFFDSHCHFDFAQFDHDREHVLNACENVGVGGIIIPGINPKQWSRASALIQNSSRPHRLVKLYYAAGIHPWWVAEYLKEASVVESDYIQANTQKALVDELTQDPCVAIGECGLDKCIELPLQDQMHVLEWHLQVAQETQKPLILHCRKADNELLRLLKKYPCNGGVIHGFSGSLELAKCYWALGFYLGIGGTITYPRAKKTREMVKAMPLQAIVLETDAPDMPLQGKQGERNSPSYIPEVASVLAQLRNESIETIAYQTRENCQQLFGI